MKYSLSTAIKIGLLLALGIVMLIILIIKLLPSNKDKYSNLNILLNIVAFILDTVAVTTNLLS